MLDETGFVALRNYIKRRVAYAQYRVGSTWYKTTLSDVTINSEGRVRVQLNVNAEESSIRVNRVELYNTEAQLWAHQDCDLPLKQGQTGIFFWFDFTFREEETS